MLVTHTSGCSASRNGQNTFWLVSQVQHEGDDGSFKIKLCVEEIAIGHCVSEVEVIWGTHTPVIPNKEGGGAHQPKPPNGESPSQPPAQLPSQPPQQPPTVPQKPDSNTTDCGAYPGPTFLGFPTAPCGDNFDLELDSIIGYYGFESDFSKDIESFASGLDSYDPGEYEDDSTSLKRDHITRALRKRGFFKKLKKAFKKVVAVVQKKIIPVVNKLVEAAKKIKKAAVKAVNAVKAVIRALDNLGGSYGPKTFTLKQGPAKDSDSPGGRQTLLYKAEDKSVQSDSPASYALGMWCVNCGVESKAVVVGTARFSLRKSHRGRLR